MDQWTNERWTNGPMDQWAHRPVVQCTMQISFSKNGNRSFKPDFHHSTHFLPIQLFPDKLFGDWPLSRFTFDIYLRTS